MNKRSVLLVIFVVFVLVISSGLFLSGLVMLVAGQDLIPEKGDIAVVKLEGEILDATGLMREFEDLAERDDIKAVVLRLDSPGGLVSASQEIYRATVRLRKEKKVVASMGGVAASGAYYIACGADKIVANEGTITGSIGVKINHVNVEELVSLLRVKPRVMTTGPYKDMGSPLRPLREDEEKLFDELIQQMYGQFKAVVATERQLEASAVDKLADGRVYTGAEAKTLGLVDSLGSLQDAVDEAAALAGLKEKPKVVYPRPRREHWARYFIQESVSAIMKGIQGARREPLVQWRL